ncbi:MAG: NHL repeat-containing protein [Thermomicrobiales bacterium]|nr:NHL repeat-containing protein [Thermomicrobiales bacterium]
MVRLRALVVALVLMPLALTSAAPDHPAPFASAPTPSQADAPRLSFVSEITGDADPLQQPSGAAVAEDGTLYVIDSARDHIRVFDAAGNPAATWGEAGSGPGQFRFSLFQDIVLAGDLAIGPDGSIYVADTFNNRIQKLAADGTFTLSWGAGGSGPDDVFEPNGIGVDAAGRVYVTGTTGVRVQVFDAEGRFLKVWDGTQGGGFPFVGAADVTIDAAGRVWVTDAGLHRVAGFQADGTPLGSFGEIGDAPGELREPLGIAVDDAGNLYVAEFSGNRVQVFAPDGVSLGTTEAGQFSGPAYVSLGPDALLYVSDVGNHRVQVFEGLPAATTTP